MKNPTNKVIKALIETPNWLGDCLMSTPAIENIVQYYCDIEITVIGSKTSIEVLKNHPKVVKAITIDSTNKFPFNSIKKLGNFDVYFSFRRSIRAKLIKATVNAEKKFQFNHKKFPNRHQVEKYVDFVNYSLKVNFRAGNLASYIIKSNIDKDLKLLGINPGASYGSAKRWYPEQFAKIAVELSDNFDIVIFGGDNETDFANEIENYLVENKIHNYSNLAGKTSFNQLAKYISNLDVFITGDSGPMHLAASFQIPTVALFGPTNPIETSQWKNPRSAIVKKNLDRQPCMKKTCPLKHHKCMKLIEAKEVVSSIYEIT